MTNSNGGINLEKAQTLANYRKREQAIYLNSSGSISVSDHKRLDKSVVRLLVLAPEADCAICNHSAFSAAEYDELTMKGWSNNRILEKWNAIN